MGRKTQFARSALGGKRTWEGDFLPGVAFLQQPAQRLGGIKAECYSELLRGMAQNTALDGDRLSSEADRVDGDGGIRGTGASAASHGLAAEQELGGQASDFRIPECFLIPGEAGHVGEMDTQLRIPLLELGEQAVADTISREGRVLVGGVFAPWLVQSA